MTNACFALLCEKKERVYALDFEISGGRRWVVLFGFDARKKRNNPWLKTHGCLRKNQRKGCDLGYANERERRVWVFLIQLNERKREKKKKFRIYLYYVYLRSFSY